MTDSTVFIVPHLISPAGGYVLKVVAASTVHGTVTDGGEESNTSVSIRLWYQG